MPVPNRGSGDGADPVDDESLDAPSAAAALGPFLRAIRARWLLVVGIVLAALAGGIVQLVVRQVEYEATAQVLVTPLPSGDRSFVGLPLPRAVGTPERALETAAEILDSPEAADLAEERVAEASGGGSAGTVEILLEDEDETQSDVLDVTATAGSPELAALTANEFVEAQLELRRRALRPLVTEAVRAVRRDLATISDPDGEAADELRTRLGDLRSISDGRDPTLALIQPASPPSSSTARPAALVIALALIGGFAIGAVVALLIELLVPGRVRDEGDLLGTYPLPVLARLPSVGVRDADFDLSELPELAPHFRSLRTQLELRSETFARRGDPEDASRGKVVVVTSPSRGDGRTTVALGLARAIASVEQRVVLFDLDLRAERLDERVKRGPEEPHLEVFSLDPVSDSQVDSMLSIGLELVAEARSRADWIIVDVAPLGEVGDALAVAATGDQLVIASRIGVTQKPRLAALRDLLDGLGTRPAGHVLIGVRSGRGRERSPLPAVPYLGPGRVTTRR